MMNELLPQQSARRLYWAAILIYFGLLSANSLATSILASLVGAKWSVLTGQEKVMIVFSVLANWTGLVLAFLRTSLIRIASGKPPIETGDTSHIQKLKP